MKFIQLIQVTLAICTFLTPLTSCTNQAAEKTTVVQKDNLGRNTLIHWTDFKNMEQTRVKNPNKLIVVDFWASWCGPCKEMDRNIYANAQIAEVINKHFIPVIFDASVDTDAFTQAKMKYSVAGLPATVFFNTDGSHIETIVGVAGATEYKKKLLELIDAHLTKK